MVNPEEWRTKPRDPAPGAESGLTFDGRQVRSKQRRFDENGRVKSTCEAGSWIHTGAHVSSSRGHPGRR